MLPSVVRRDARSTTNTTTAGHVAGHPGVDRTGCVTSRSVGIYRRHDGAADVEQIEYINPFRPAGWPARPPARDAERRNATPRAPAPPRRRRRQRTRGLAVERNLTGAQRSSVDRLCPTMPTTIDRSIGNTSIDQRRVIHRRIVGCWARQDNRRTRTMHRLAQDSFWKYFQFSHPRIWLECYVVDSRWKNGCKFQVGTETDCNHFSEPFPCNSENCFNVIQIEVSVVFCSKRSNTFISSSRKSSKKKKRHF